MFILDISHGIWAVQLHTFGSDGWPSVLRQWSVISRCHRTKLTSSKYIFFLFPWSTKNWRSSNTNGQAFFARILFGCIERLMGQLILTSRSSLCKEGQHVNIDRVDDIEDILSSFTLLITACTIASDVIDTGKISSTHMQAQKQWQECEG